MSHYTSFVLVDFENVPEANLGLVEGLPAHVTLLIGKSQTWLSDGQRFAAKERKERKSGGWFFFVILAFFCG